MEQQIIDTSQIFRGVFPSLDCLADKFCHKHGFLPLAATEREREEGYAYWSSNVGSELLHCDGGHACANLKEIIADLFLGLNAKVFKEWCDEIDANPWHDPIPPYFLWLKEHSKVTECQQKIITMMEDLYCALCSTNNNKTNACGCI